MHKVVRKKKEHGKILLYVEGMLYLSQDTHALKVTFGGISKYQV